MIVNVYGCGKMATHLIVGMYTNLHSLDIHTYTPSFTRADELAQKVKGQSYRAMSEMPKNADIHLIGCKPQQFDEFASLWREQATWTDASVIVSMMAGIKAEKIASKLDCPVEQVVRMMPNTPVSVGEGVTLLYSLVERPEIEDLFRPVGRIHSFKSERDFDFATGITGSGPAYVFEMIRILGELLQRELKLDEKEAELLVAQTFLGASRLFLAHEINAQTQREAVTSKGGVTQKALEQFERGDLAGLMEKAMMAAFKRSNELSS